MTNTTHANENLTVHLKVKDYATWRTGYDGREKGRLSAGITNGRVLRSPEDLNDVVILQDVADVSKARSWLASDDMKGGDAEERCNRNTHHPLRGLSRSSGNR
jgi:hypothetical protein